MTKQRTVRQVLLRGAAWTFPGRVVSVGAVFAIHVLLGRGLASEDYAAFVLVYAAVQLCMTIAVVGTPQILVRAVRMNVVRSDYSGVLLAVRICFSIVVIGCGVVTLVVLMTAGLLGDGPKWRGLVDFRWMVTAWFSSAAIAMVIGRLLQSFDDFGSAVLIGGKNAAVLPSGLALIAVVILGQQESLTLESAVGIHAMSYGVALAVGVGLACYRLKRLSVQLEETESAKDADLSPAVVTGGRWFLGECWSNYLLQLVRVGLAEADVFIVGGLASAALVADYGTARRLVGAVSAPLIMINNVISPTLADLAERGQIQRLERLLRRSASWVAMPALVVLVAYLVAPVAVIGATFGGQYMGAVLPLRILALGAVVHVLCGSNGAVLVMTGNQRALMVCTIASAGLFVVCLPPAVFRYGIVGAAVVSALTAILANLVITIVVKRRIGIWTTASLSPALVFGGRR